MEQAKTPFSRTNTELIILNFTNIHLWYLIAPKENKISNKNIKRNAYIFKK